MRAIALGLSLLACSFAMGDVYHVLHRRPSALLANLSGASAPGDRVFVLDDSMRTHSGFLQARGLKFWAHDSESIITIDGPKDAVEDAKGILGLFDVAPRQIKAKIRVHSPADKYDSSTDTQMSNNVPWTLEDGTTTLRFSIVPRINNDGTVTGSIQVQSKSKQVNLVTRAKVGEPIVICMNEDGSFSFPVQSTDTRFGVSAVRSGRSSDLATAVTFTVTFEIPPAKR